MLLWTIRLLEGKVSGLSGFSESDPCDVDRSSCGDILARPFLAVGLSERSCGGRPFAFDPWLATG